MAGNFTEQFLIEVVLQASPRAPRPALGFPTPPRTALAFPDLPQQPCTLLKDAQKTTRLDGKMPQSGSRYPGLFQSSQATVLERWASPDLLRPPWMQLDTSWSLGKLGISSVISTGCKE